MIFTLQYRMIYHFQNMIILTARNLIFLWDMSPVLCEINLLCYRATFSCKEGHPPKQKWRKTCRRTRRLSLSLVLKHAWWLEVANFWILVSGCTSPYRIMLSPPLHSEKCNINKYRHQVHREANTSQVSDIWTDKSLYSAWNFATLPRNKIIVK